MGVKLPLNSSNAAMLEAVEKWIELLSNEEYDQAYNFTEHDEYHEWTPELIEKIINNYGALESDDNCKINKVTPINKVLHNQNIKPYREVTYFDEPIINEDLGAEVAAEIWYSLPLNDEWSDLTATFHVLKKNDHLTLLLQDIHVF